MPRRRTLPGAVHHSLHISAATPSFSATVQHNPHFCDCQHRFHSQILIVSIKFMHGIVFLSKYHGAPPSPNNNFICFAPTNKAPPSSRESCPSGLSCPFPTTTLFVLSERQTPCPFRLTSPFAISQRLWIVVFCDRTKLQYYCGDR